MDVIQENTKQGTEANLKQARQQGKLDFTNLDVESIRPKKEMIEYASVKVRADIFEQIKDEAMRHGIKQPGKFISLILETYLKQLQDQQGD